MHHYEDHLQELKLLTRVTSSTVIVCKIKSIGMIPSFAESFLLFTDPKSINFFLFFIILFIFIIFVQSHSIKQSKPSELIGLSFTFLSPLTILGILINKSDLFSKVDILTSHWFDCLAQCVRPSSSFVYSFNDNASSANFRLAAHSDCGLCTAVCEQ